MLSRFLTVAGSVEGPRRPKIAKSLRRDFFTTLEVWECASLPALGGPGLPREGLRAPKRRPDGVHHRAARGRPEGAPGQPEARPEGLETGPPTRSGGLGKLQDHRDQDSP